MIQKNDIIKAGKINIDEKVYWLNELSFDQIAYKGGTGRGYIIPGPGNIKTHGYRVGCTTNIGDIERSEWIQIIKYLIKKNNEEKLYAQLYEWESDHNYCNYCKKELEEKVLELHSIRIFDDEQWCDFLKFNEKYRPEILANIKLKKVITDCCMTPAFVTETMVDNAWQYGGVLCCPICGRYSKFKSEE